MLRPKRLPRGYSNIIVGVLYHPPGTNNIAMKDHLIIIIIPLRKVVKDDLIIVIRKYYC
jgi:hypothetical protein